jgi:hypothetical protein
MIGIDALWADAKLFERSLLGGEVLLIGGAAGVADRDHRHGGECTIKGSSIERIIVPSD